MVCVTMSCGLALTAPDRASAVVNSTDTVLGKSVESSAALRASAPDVSALGGIVQSSSGSVLWTRNPDKRYAPASTTKVMTALLVLRSTSATDLVSVDQSATALNGAKVGLVAGKKYTVRNLVEAMLVPSGCDAAYALAVHAAGSEKAFVSWMNAEAARLGLKNTHFENSTGLDASGAYISARDLAKLTKEAMKSAEFSRVIRLQSTVVNGKTLPATNLLLRGYPGSLGGKTGSTRLAGHSIVSRAVRSGADVTVVVLGSPTDTSRYQDAARLLDWGLLRTKSGVVTSYTTVHDPNKLARLRNIAVAAASLEGRSIPAGRVASFNTLVGERTTARGFVPADAIVGGALIQQVGGGVCQVSTTMFNTALIGGFPIVERRPHSMYISSYPTGRDATVSWGGPDFRFGNNTSSTLTVRALASAFTMTVGIAQTKASGCASLAATPLATYSPMPVKYVLDTTLAPGTTKVRIQGQAGLTTAVTRTIKRPDGTTRATDRFVSTFPPITRVIAVAPSAN